MNEQRRESAKEEMYTFLDALKESGKTNMFGASPYLREEFGLTRFDANRTLSLWMKNYNERNP